MRAIMAVTTTLLLCGLVFAQAINRGDRAKIRETRETMSSLQLDLATVRQIDGVYPDALKAIIDNKLREALPKDAWGRDFAYGLSTEHGYKITSWGADGKAGGEGGNADIVWTQAGELREMSAEDRAAYQAKLEEARFQASRLIARERMIVAGNEAVNYHRNNSKWPAKLLDCKKTGDSKTDTAINACFSDPWGHEFTLKTLPKENFAIVCWGADGKEDGTGRDADFVITERDVREGYNAFRDEWWGWNPWEGSNGDWRVQDLAQDVQRYKQRYGKLPEELIELTRPGQPVEGKESEGPVQAIRNALPKDAWGNDYIYVRITEEEFYVVGLGKDGIEGGVKDNKDVIHPAPGTDPGNMGMMDDWGEAIAPPKPEQDDNEVLVEVANELMLDIVDKCNAYHTKNAKYPASLDDIKDEFVGKNVPLDPWETSFVYALTKDGEAITGFTVTCLGSDSAEGGEGHAADITFDQDGEPKGGEDATYR
jgi:hypothetical protein